MDDFRKACPTYVNFTPRTAAEAIDKFHRYKKRGVPPRLWPEIFVNVASELPDSELDKFEAFLVNPTGMGETAASVCKSPWVDQVNCENEAVRKQLLKESQARDAPPLQTFPASGALGNVILESYCEEPDEKSPEPELSSMLGSLSVSDSDDMVMVPS